MKIKLELTVDRESPSQRFDNFLNGILDRFSMIVTDILTEEVHEQGRKADILTNALFSSLAYGISRNFGARMVPQRLRKEEPRKEELRKEPQEPRKEPQEPPGPGLQGPHTPELTCQHDMYPDRQPDGIGGVVAVMRCTKCPYTVPRPSGSGPRGDW